MLPAFIQNYCRPKAFNHCKLCQTRKVLIDHYFKKINTYFFSYYSSYSSSFFFFFCSLFVFLFSSVADFVQEGYHWQPHDLKEYNCAFKNLGYLAIYLEKEVLSRLEDDSAKGTLLIFENHIFSKARKDYKLHRLVCIFHLEIWKKKKSWHSVRESRCWSLMNHFVSWRFLLLITRNGNIYMCHVFVCVCLRCM